MAVGNKPTQSSPSDWTGEQHHDAPCFSFDILHEINSICQLLVERIQQIGLANLLSDVSQLLIPDKNNQATYPLSDVALFRAQPIRSEADIFVGISSGKLEISEMSPATLLAAALDHLRAKEGGTGCAILVADQWPKSIIEQHIHDLQTLHQAGHHFLFLKFKTDRLVPVNRQFFRT